jgi:dTDP-4-dehydrorhamnose 3,5-epimerase
MTGRLEIRPTGIAGLHVVVPRRLADTRGFFERSFCAQELTAAGWNAPVAQINQSVTEAAGTVRGLHFQHPPHAEMKLVRCTQGSVFDVAVDLRPDSPTYRRWHAETLSDADGRGLLIPPGLAHGFQTLTTRCRMLYVHSVAFHPESQGGIHPLDPTLDIAWPEPIELLSDRDAALPFLEA